ncbi:folate-binding protein YgfZ [Mycobacterium sp. 1274756.6]|uniref:CAF17-like 4Fe-4S cluster assembly/insertion protein YgfZ n=1 Tax=Mycobacterium sp. 1274756.6 TaxID=1834076 RepID=UPI000800F473|nr:folate-binding protein YgfZ [Mycobacterium sp. 1274756.6]OBJ70232.1 glycine cleavage system protein T [Mycobacterium sp. 1274756.6]
MTAVPAPDTGPDAGAIWHYGDPLGEQHAAATAAVVIDRSHRAVLTITGPERLSWLHTLCTQHVADLSDGASTENLFLDGQGRVQDHWLQTELGGVSYLDTESWRGEPLTTYLRSMVFWADVAVEPAELAVLSLLGPGLADPAVPAALGVDALPDEQAALPLPDGGFVRRVPGTGGDTIELDVLVPTGQLADLRQRLNGAGLRPAGVWAYEAHRVAAVRPRLGVDTDERTIPHEVGWIGGPGTAAVHLDKGCYRGQETVARVHNLGKPPRMLALLHLDGATDRPETGNPVRAGGRAVGRLGTVVDHAELGPIALALLKRGLPAETPLLTGAEEQVAAVIDADSLPPPDAPGAGRLAVERLRGR